MQVAREHLKGKTLLDAALREMKLGAPLCWKSCASATKWKTDARICLQGKKRRGDLVQGTLEGADSGVIADQLLNTGITPTEIKQTSQAARSGSSPEISLWKRLSTEKKVDVLELMLFSRQMYTLLKAGVPIMRALAGLQESTQNPAFAAMLQDMRESLDSGRELSVAHAPPSQGILAVLSQHGAGRRNDRHAGCHLPALVRTS